MIAALIIAALIFYWPVIALKGTIWNDFIEQYFPYRVFATRALRHLTFPFWNPYSFSGMPFFADIQSAVLYPLNLLLVPFGGANGLSPVLFEYQIVFHVMLAGFFTYLLARDFKRGRTASLLAGFVFMLGGFTTTHIFHITMIHSLPWFVGSVLLLRRALDRSSVIYAIATSFTLCFVAFAGHPQMYVYLHYLLGAFLLFHLYKKIRGGTTPKQAAVPVAIFLLAVALGAGLSSIQLLPTSRLSRESVRPEMEFDKTAQGSFRPYRFITLLAPNFFSMPNAFREKAPVYWGISEKDIDPGAHYYWETALYLGVLPLLLAGFALAFSRSPPVAFLGIIAFGSFLIAMGDAAPFFRLAYSFLPGFRMFRNPARIGVIFTLAMSLLAAFGADWLFSQGAELTPQKKRRWAIALGTCAGMLLLAATVFSEGAFKPLLLNFILQSGMLGTDAAQIESYVSEMIYPFAAGQIGIFTLFALAGIGIVAAGLFHLLPLRVVSFILPLLVGIDLLMFGYGFAAEKTNPRTIYETNRLIRSIQEENKREYFRINSRGSIPGSDEIGGPYMIFRRNEGTVHSICLMEGYNPLRLKRQLMDRKDRTLDILNVKYKIKVDEQSRSVDIVPHPTYLPRARMVPSYRIITDGKKILPAFNDPEFDYVNEVILEEKPAFVEPGFHQAGASSARITSWGLNRMVTEVSIDRPALLVLSEVYYPAWKATIDGKKAKVLRADYALRAIAVPAGKHTVVCKYDDDSFKKGLALSLISLLAALGAIGWNIYGNRLRKKRSI